MSCSTESASDEACWHRSHTSTGHSYTGSARSEGGKPIARQEANLPTRQSRHSVNPVNDATPSSSWHGGAALTHPAPNRPAIGLKGGLDCIANRHSIAENNFSAAHTRKTPPKRYWSKPINACTRLNILRFELNAKRKEKDSTVMESCAGA